ncbi:MAG TPA: helix-turn-helix domain-containing protein [Phycisphaerae bacterium]|nr:helix-turn-helix domain-containing protein [Phycisphaerae bacterium]
MPLSRVVREQIIRVYERMGRHKTRAARVLDIDIKTLYNKLKRYGVQ